MKSTVAPQNAGRYRVRCRCGALHPIPDVLADCSICGTPTIDAHLVCNGHGCRAAEALEQHAERTVALVTEVMTT